MPYLSAALRSSCRLYTTKTTMTALRIVLGGDEAGFAYKAAIAKDLAANARVCKVIDVGPSTSNESVLYSKSALSAAEKVASGEADRALLICGTGLGVSIAANKVKGIRAVTAHDSYSVESSVRGNNAQVLCLGARVVGLELARRLVREWLSYDFDENSPVAANTCGIDEYENKTQ